ncbi:MAG TPA: sulfatase-like hydrolase/transferase [Thermomicrobiales bacterium]|nr:sulfatase-like hydrolase/transferase [Thermomicrobiales bacterium]
MATSPNVIVFLTDQQRWDTTGLHGNPLDLTPNLDRVAREGTHVRYSFTCQPVCGPARSSLQTGLYATQTGCFTNGIPLDPELPSLAKWFRGAGYRTGYIGKWHLASQDPVPEAERGGYQDWLASNVLEFTSDAYDTVMYDESGEPRKLPGYRVDALTDAAIDYVDRHQHDPFFLFISYLEPHHQNHRDDYPAPVGYRERYEGRWMPPDLAALGGTAHQQYGGYCGMVKRLDEAYGRLLDALQSLNLLDDTIVLFTADHGNHFKTRNGEYKRSLHEASIRVPTVLTGPGFTGGGEVRELVSLIDLPPTLLDAAGIEVPEKLPGRSLLDLVQRRCGDDWPDDVYIQISESHTGRAIRTRRWKYGVAAPDVTSPREPYSDTYGEMELYDLVADPHELNNLVHEASHEALCDALRARLLRRMREVGEPPAEIIPARRNPSGQRRVAEAELLS